MFFLLLRGVDGCMGCSLYIPVMSHRKEQQERRHAARHSLTQVTFKPPKKDCSTANILFFNTDTAAASILSTLKIRTTNSAPPRSPAQRRNPICNLPPQLPPETLSTDQPPSHTRTARNPKYHPPVQRRPLPGLGSEQQVWRHASF